MDLIHTYTRKEAIEDGNQFKLDPTLTKEAGFNYPVFMTSGVYDIIKKAVANERYCNDFDGIVWDILNMLRFTIDRTKTNGSRIGFVVKIMGAARKQNFMFISTVGPLDIDNQAPALTIMLPEED